MPKIIQENGQFFIQKELSEQEMRSMLLEATSSVANELNEIERYRAEIARYKQVIDQHESTVRAKLENYGITEEFLDVCKDNFPSECNRLKVFQ